MTNRRWLIALGAALALGACGDDASTAGDAGESDTGGDPAIDADASVVATCVDLPTAGAAFEVDPDGPDTQIHGALAFDGEAIWIAYNLPNEDGEFEVWASRRACDGGTLLAPLRLHDPSADNLVDPAVAVSGDTVLFAWQSDSGAAENNLDIWYALLGSDGTIRTEAARFEGVRGGAANPLNAFMPAVGATADGFVLAGAWGTPDAPGFQVFVQRMTTDGQPAGETIDGTIDTEASQTFPGVAGVGSDVLVAWSRDDGDTQTVVHTRIAAGANVSTPSPAVPVLDSRPGQGPSYVSGGADDTYVAYTGEDGDVVLARCGVFDGQPASITVGDSTRIDHSPTVVAQRDRGAVAYYRNVRGFSNELWVQQFEWTGASFTLGRAVRVDDSGQAAPYAPALLHLGGDRYLAVWSDGTSPAFRLLGRVVSMST